MKTIYWHFTGMNEIGKEIFSSKIIVEGRPRPISTELEADLGTFSFETILEGDDAIEQFTKLKHAATICKSAKITYRLHGLLMEEWNFYGIVMNLDPLSRFEDLSDEQGQYIQACWSVYHRSSCYKVHQDILQWGRDILKSKKNGEPNEIENAD
jgi:hypothetical protein